MRAVLCTAFLVALGSLAAADPPDAPKAPAPPTVPAADPTAAAEEVVAAHGRGDRGALESLARRAEPDPWLVVDEILARGDAAAARAFASLVPGPIGKRLVVLLEQWQAGLVADSPTGRAAFEKASKALRDRDAEGALAATDDPELRPGTILRARIAWVRISALRALGRDAVALAAARRLVDDAEGMGWLALAMRCAFDAGVAAHWRKDEASAAEWMERTHRLAREAGDLSMTRKSAALAGSAYQALGEYPKAAAILTKAYEEAEASGDKPAIVAAATQLGILQFWIGDARKAIPLHERALALSRELGDERGAVRAKGNLALSLSTAGEIARAAAMQEEVLAALEKAGDRAGVSDSLANLGRDRFQLGEFAKALDLFRRARETKLALGQRERAAGILGNVGLVRLETGDLQGARETLQRAYDEQVAIGDKPAAASTLLNIAKVRFLLGDFAEALSLYERVHETLQRMGDRNGAATSLSAQGSIYDHLGQPEKGLMFHERVVEERRALGDKPGVATALSNVASARMSLGDLPGALAAFEASLGEFQALGMRAELPGALTNLGHVHRALGHRDLALRRYREALEAFGGADAPDRPIVLQALARAHLEAGDLAEAQRRYAEAVDVAQRMHASDTLAGAEIGLARAKWAAGDAEATLDLARRAVPRVESSRRGLSDEVGAVARSGLADVYALGLMASSALKRTEDAAFFLESGRARGLLEGIGSREAVQAATIPAALREAEAAARTAEANAARRLARARAEGDRAKVAVAAREADAADAAVQASVERIQREAARGASFLYPQVATIDEARAALAPGDAMVLYALTEDDLFALVLTPAEARLARLAPVRELFPRLERLSLDDPRSDPAEALAAVRSILADRLALPDGVTRVLVCPDGPLTYVPFSLLFPTRATVGIPSATVYRQFLADAVARGEGVLAVGDPDFAEVPAPGTPSRAGRAGALPRLPATRDEAKAVGDRLLLGKDATEAGLRSALAERKRWRAVHLATHGLVDAERPSLSALALTPTAEDDGFLKAVEVLRTSVPADLVVLSACETGRGKVVLGEGLVGLARSFMYAGAPRVLCSLWKVDDEATAALMSRFYALWNPKDGSKPLGTADALRAAQESVRSRPAWKHPYYWAAWVLWGVPD
jgi:CHAT domain-containing protein